MAMAHRVCAQRSPSNKQLQLHLVVWVSSLLEIGSFKACEVEGAQTTSLARSSHALTQVYYTKAADALLGASSPCTLPLPTQGFLWRSR